MDLHDSTEDAAFRAEARHWLEANLTGEFAEARGLGRAGLQHEGRGLRTAWERKLGEDGWTCVGWPLEYGGRGAPMWQQVIWNEEYVRADAPARVNVMGEGLLGPTLIAYGTDEQKQRFLNPIRWGTELWCQGYSEPDAGSDLANVQTKAVLEDDEWVITGQKVWTSYAQWADWCFVLCRTDPGAQRHRGLSYLLVPMDQPGVEIRPIQQITGTSEFNEVFFDRAHTDADLVVGEVNDGWRVALATLAFERGVGLLGDIVGFRKELDHLLELAHKNGSTTDKVLRQRLASIWIRLYILRLNTLRSLTGVDGPVAPPQASISKLFWATWHRDLGELAMDVLGMHAEVAEFLPYELGDLQRIFLFSRADTIYGGSNEIQRNIIGERVLGLPPEPKVSASKGDPSP
jgi:alkylation response protein AidB-like acyl-CoA dehydrogenase